MLYGIGMPTFLLGILLVVFDMQDKAINGALLSAVAVLCALPNVLIFFKALQKNKDAQAYGTLVSTILWALFTFGIKLFG